MRTILAIIFCLLAFPVIANAQDKEPPNIEPQPIRDYGFDSWGDIPFGDEKARLDYLAQQMQLAPDMIVSLEYHMGKRACVGEAKARALRAKNYLVKKWNIKAERIKCRD